MRIKSFWTPDELGPRVVQLVDDIQAHFQVLQDEGLAAAVEGKLPRGEKPFGQAFLVKEGAGWDQVTVWGGPIRGFDLDLCAGATKRTCGLLEQYQDLFHPKGEVKFSHMVGPTKVVPHCGPVDTKIRMHMMIKVTPLFLFLFLFFFLNLGNPAPLPRPSPIRLSPARQCCVWHHHVRIS